MSEYQEALKAARWVVEHLKGCTDEVGRRALMLARTLLKNHAIVHGEKPEA